MVRKEGMDSDDKQGKIESAGKQETELHTTHSRTYALTHSLRMRSK